MVTQFKLLFLLVRIVGIFLNVLGIGEIPKDLKKEWIPMGLITIEIYLLIPIGSIEYFIDVLVFTNRFLLYFEVGNKGA